MSRRKPTINDELRKILSDGFVLDIQERRMLLFKYNKWINLDTGDLMQAILSAIGLLLNRWDYKANSGFWYI